MSVPTPSFEPQAAVNESDESAAHQQKEARDIGFSDSKGNLRVRKKLTQFGDSATFVELELRGTTTAPRSDANEPCAL